MNGAELSIGQSSVISLFVPLHQLENQFVQILSGFSLADELVAPPEQNALHHGKIVGAQAQVVFRGFIAVEHCWHLLLFLASL